MSTMNSDISPEEYKERPLYLEQRAIVDALSPKYGEGEARAMARIIFEQLKGWSPTDTAIRANEPVSEFLHQQILSVVERILADEPIQYIFGVADFYGMKLSVNPAVLIPRPETAELVDIIVKENTSKDLRVVDFGTGSGCIAIALARNLLFPEVTAVDLNPAALDTARDNAKRLFARITFVEADILALNESTPALLAGSFDIIVSNPPYIAESEKSAMEANVLLHEPATALFVPDSDPLRFYRSIIDYAVVHLSPSGTLYFEINPLFVNQLADMAAAKGFSAAIHLDSFGRRRFAVLKKKSEN